MTRPQIRTYKPGDEEQIQALFAETFGRERSLERWRWRFLGGPRGPALIQILESSGSIGGHLAHVPLDVFVDGMRLRLGHGGDMMVAANLRARGGMWALIEDFLARDHGFDLRINFPTNEATALGERYGSGVHLGRLRRSVRVFSTAYLARHRGVERLPAAGLVDGLMRGVVRLTMAGKEVEIREVGDLTPEFDVLAQRSVHFARCIRVRDVAYLSWRWFAFPGEGRQMLEARRNGDLVGWVVLDPRSDLDSEDKVGQVVDLLAEDAIATRHLLNAAAECLCRAGCDAAAFEYLDPRSWTARTCLRAGFLPRGHGPNVMTKSLSDRAGRSVESRNSWYLTKGDTDLA